MSFAAINSSRLPRSFFLRDVVTVARGLLGQKLVRVCDGERLAGIIVETEAYLGIPDKAAHTVGGRRTARNEAMWQVGGTLYVYFTYGMHHCMNVVAQAEGEPVAALIRALEPVEGLDAIRANRQAGRRPRATPLRPRDLCSGPAKLCQALAIDRGLNGADLVASGEIFIERTRKRAFPAAQIATGPRVGVAYAEEWADRPLRFCLRDNPHVSKP
jgi:DNA-3-methyladenine glycosylase